mmetsp:Transcript_48682/g.157289  ORF Transcript_48682/g.157289 Transcript_48682/m.157289 type:complete len:143 (-) Transcript_48682:200-628(-)
MRMSLEGEGWFSRNLRQCPPFTEAKFGALWGAMCVDSWVGPDAECASAVCTPFSQLAHTLQLVSAPVPRSDQRLVFRDEIARAIAHRIYLEFYSTFRHTSLQSRLGTHAEFTPAGPHTGAKRIAGGLLPCDRSPGLRALSST